MNGDKSDGVRPNGMGVNGHKVQVNADDDEDEDADVGMEDDSDLVCDTPLAQKSAWQQ